MLARVIFLVGLGYVSAWGQNLVLNPSFESFEDCPNKLGTFDRNVTHWSVPSKGTTDYFNTCSKVTGAPENFNGIQHPVIGNAYAGFYFFAPNDYREYIQGTLQKTLENDQSYVLEFHVSLAEGSDFAVKDFGVVLSQYPLNINTQKYLSKGELYGSTGNKVHLLEIVGEEIYKDKKDWLTLRTRFIAKGFENYLTIGNLRNNKTTQKVQTSRKATRKGAYYYIDLVFLGTEEHANGSLEEKIENYKPDTLYVFKNVPFDFDRYSLDAEGRKSVSKVFRFLERHPNYRIEIKGHTDNLGTETYNARLSTLRAAAIATYLVELGLEANRVSYKGFGSSLPIDSNQNEIGRKKNRRAEFVIRD